MLTGPFDRPRASAPLARLLLPVLPPAMTRLLGRPGVAPKLAAAVLLVVALSILILIGQTVPVLLACFGLAVTGRQP